MKNPLAIFCLRLLLLIPLWLMVACNYTPDNKLKENSDLLIANELRYKGSYDSAIIFFEKSADKSLKLNQYDLWINSVTGTIDCFRAKGNFEEALRITNQSKVIAKIKIDTTSNYYNILIYKEALLYSDKRQVEQAIALLNRNIKIYLSKAATADTGLALTYNGLGTIYLLQRNFNEALLAYEKAQITYEKAQHIYSPDYASSLLNIGIVYSNIGNYEKAEQYFLRSVKVFKEVLRPDDPKLASSYLNMGRFYQLIRNDSKAIEYMKLAENFFSTQNQSNSVTAGSLFLNMGVFYIYTAEYEKAQSYLDKSLEILSAKAPGNLENLLTIYLNMGFIAEKRGDFAAARMYYTKGYSIGDKLSNSVKVLRGLASVSYSMYDKQSTDKYYKEALKKSIEMYGEDHPETALTYLKYGDFLSITENKSALLFLNKSLNVYKKVFGQVNIDVSTAYFYLGSYYFRTKKYSQAIEYFQLSLTSGFQGFSSKTFNDNPSISKENLNENLLNPLIAKAKALFLLYKSNPSKLEYLKGSAESFSLSLKLIEMLRSTYQNEDSKLFISENEKNTFSNALLTQVELFKKTQSMDALEQAFSLSEKGKSAVLLSHLRDKEAKNIGRIPEDLKTQDASLKSEIFFYNKQIHDQKLSAKPDEEKIKQWNSKLFDLGQKQEKLIKTIEKDYPAYFNLKYDNTVVSINEIQKKLSPKQAVVEYTYTDSTLYTFVVTSTKKQLITSELDSSFFNAIRLLREQLSGKHYNNYTKADYTAFTVASYDLYHKLLFPVESIITGKELIIIPDGELGYLSFDVLLTSMPDTSKIGYKKLPYLIRKSALNYAPSATTFFNDLKLKSTKNNGKVLAYGPNYRADNTVLDQKDEAGKPLRNVLTDLDNTQDEINSLKNFFNIKAFLDEKATEKSFKKNASDYKVLHLAMHTIINNENPLYSKLVFFKPKGDTTEDGMLNASELINMELHAEMAVLSACNTGSGKMQKGEGIMSLSRDFFYAGVPGIVMTAWAVEDRTGKKLMEYFYKNIALGKPRNEALQLAKLEYLDNCDKLTSHPHYWAAYMNVGDISPLTDFNKNTFSKMLVGAAATLFTITLLVFLRLRKKKNSKKLSS